MKANEHSVTFRDLNPARSKTLHAWLLCLFATGVLAVPTAAATRYVNLNNPAPAAPYTDWGTAATNIQDAIDVASNHDEIVVTNGIYATGSRFVNFETNRVAVTNTIVLRSVNGPEATIIVGSATLPTLAEGPYTVV